MKNILAENMLRFGAKNLSESDLYRISQRTLLKEIVGTIQTMPPINIQTLLSNSDFAAAAKVAQTWITQNKLLFNIPNANVWLAISAIITEPVRYPILQKVAKAMSKGETEQMIKLLMNGFVAKGMGTLSQYVMDGLQYAKKNSIEIQLNEHPDYSGKVLTNGTIDATQFTAGDTNGVSSITDIVTFMNDHNLSNAITNPFGDNNIAIDPTDNGSFVKGKIGTDPGAGALDIEFASGPINYQPVLYSTFKFAAAAAKTTGTAITDITFTPGPELESNLGKQLFDTGTITPEPNMAQKVKQAVDAAKSLGTITAARIESGASFDRPVNVNNAAFAKLVGMTPNKVPADPRVNKLETVTDPMSGGNAFLAHYRGIAIQNALGTQAGVTPTMVAKVEKGGDDAQYAKIFFTVKKADNSTTVTRDDVKTIGKKSASTDLSGQFKIIKFDII